MKLYYNRLSSASRRVRIALALLHIAHEVIEIDLTNREHHEPWYTAIHSQHLVPALETDEGVVLTQSEAIVSWLNDIADGIPLFGRGPAEHAAILEIVNVIGCDVHALQGLRLAHWLEHEGVPDTTFNTIARRAIAEGLHACERKLAGNAGGPFCLGVQPRAADIWLIPQMANARRYDVDMTGLPRLMDIEHACLELDAFRTVMQDNRAHRGEDRSSRSENP